MLVRFYFTASKAKVFKQELAALGPNASAALSEAMKRYSNGQPFGREVKSLGRRVKGHMLYEIRATLDGNEYRVLFANLGKGGHVMLALTALHKQQQKLPKSDVDRAVARLDDWLARGNAM